MAGRVPLPGKAFIIGVLAALTAMPETARAQGRDFPTALFGAITTPFRAITRGRGRPPSIARPPAAIAQPPLRLTRPTLSRKARASRNATLRRDRKPAGETSPMPEAPAAAAGAATAAIVAAPGREARPAVPDNLVPAVAAPSPQGRATQPPPVVASWVGPLYWPYAADDLLDYVFLPSGASDRFWSHGGGDLFQAMFAPAAPRTASWMEMCGSRQGGASAWIGPIEQAVKPTEAQRLALDDVRKALVNANNGIKDACPGAETQANPTQRLTAMADRVWAMRQAVVLVRIPFETFYNSLTGNQKARLTDDRARTDGRAGDPAGRPNEAVRLCATMTAQWPAEQIERRVRPSDEQRRGLETLRMTMMGMGQLLMASCPQDDTTTPLARLDAAEKRLNAMLYAARVVAPAFNGFYASLSDEQKAGFIETARGRDATSGTPRTGGER